MLLTPLSIEQISDIFDMSPSAVRARLSSVDPVERGYEFLSAAEKLVTPRVDIDDYLRGMRPRDLPRQHKPEFWTGMRERLEALHDSEEIWSIEAITYILGQSLALIKRRLILMPDNLSDTIRLSEEHREALAKRTTLLMQDIHDTLAGLKLRDEKSLPLSVELMEVNERLDTVEDAMEAALDAGATPADETEDGGKIDDSHAPVPIRASRWEISLEGLQRVFGRDRRTIKALIAALDPVGDDRGNPTYDIADAASYLVRPKIDLGLIIEDLGITRVPVAINTAYWRARGLRQDYEAEAAQYYLDVDVRRVCDEVIEIVTEIMDEARAQIALDVDPNNPDLLGQLDKRLPIIAKDFVEALERYLAEGNKPRPRDRREPRLVLQRRQLHDHPGKLCR